jgi:annexin A7/11
MGTDELQVCAIISSANTAQLRAMAQAYQSRYQRSLEECIRKEFSGHMQDAAMAGAGTKDTALVRRIIMVHWNRDRLQQCKGAYRHYYKKELAQRIKDETRGDYEKLMVACVSP